MYTNTGYRQMLRDKTPKLVIFALKYCKATEAWLDHVYKNFIWIYSNKQERLEATKVMLGYRNRHKEFKFEDTIDWENLSKDDEAYWKRIAGWVSWFQKKYSYIENEYTLYKSKGTEIQDIKYRIMLNWLTALCPTKEDDAKTREFKNKKLNELTDFLINCFEDNISR